MKKSVRINNDKVKKLVNEKLKQDGTFVHESKIDKAIRQYLNERKEGLDPEDAPEYEEKNFSERVKKSFGDMNKALYDIVEDLMIIQTKEPDVLVDMYPEEVYSESYIGEVVNQLEIIIEHLEYLESLDQSDFEDFINV
jgi:hypothetical protein